MTAQITYTEIEAWLIDNLALQIGIASSELDPTKPLTDYGIDSLMALLLAGDLEEWLDLQISPTVAWDYKTVRDLATYISNLLERAAAMPSPREDENEQLST